MAIPEVAGGQAVIGTACWSCGAQLYKTVPRRRRGLGHVLWACDDCGVLWSDTYLMPTSRNAERTV